MAGRCELNINMNQVVKRWVTGKWSIDLDSKTTMRIYISKAGICEGLYVKCFWVSAHVPVPN